jgi:class 3 adenylate cyclase/Tfp pilus assembly protein PilF
MKYRFCHILVFILIVSVRIQAQSGRADSLKLLLGSAPRDTHRVSLLSDYAWEIVDDNPEEALSLTREAVQLAQQLGYRKGEAAAWNTMGVAEEVRDSTESAIECYLKAKKIREETGDRLGVASILNNLGNVYENQGKLMEALAERKASLRIVEELGDTVRIARSKLSLGILLENMGLMTEAFEQVDAARYIFDAKADSMKLAVVYTNIGHIHLEMGLYDKAVEQYRAALHIRQKTDDPESLATALIDLANALDELKSDDSTRVAIGYYEQALKIRESAGDIAGIAEIYNNMGDAYKHLEDYDRAMVYLRKGLDIQLDLDSPLELMRVYNNIGDVLYGQGKYQEALKYTFRYAKIAEEADDKKFIIRSLKDFGKLYAALGDWKKAYDYRVQYDELRWGMLNEQRAKDFERKEALFTDGRKQREIDRQNHELAQAKTRTWALIGGALALALLVLLLFNRNRIRKRANRDLAAKNNQIEQERERADALLRNILPEKTAAELKINNAVKPQRYESVTVLFSDFKGFTSVAELLSPEELVQELDECFRCFDSIVDKYGLEKIKTIGDAYMCAGGLPEPSETHALDTVRAALEMQREMQRIIRNKISEGKPYFEMRIGVHTGPVVAGVVGFRKFAYDIWGDTVNTAARLEQGGEPGKVNISETTWEAVKDQFNCHYRGKLPAKNKGEIAMYFVE